MKKRHIETADDIEKGNLVTYSCGPVTLKGMRVTATFYKYSKISGKKVLRCDLEDGNGNERSWIPARHLKKEI